MCNSIDAENQVQCQRRQPPHTFGPIGFVNECTSPEAHVQRIAVVPILYVQN